MNHPINIGSACKPVVLRFRLETVGVTCFALPVYSQSIGEISDSFSTIRRPTSYQKKNHTRPPVIQFIHIMNMAINECRLVDTAIDGNGFERLEQHLVSLGPHPVAVRQPLIMQWGSTHCSGSKPQWQLWESHLGKLLIYTQTTVYSQHM